MRDFYLPRSMPNGSPTHLKLFNPDGRVQEATGWIGIREHPESNQLLQFFLLGDKFGDPIEPLNKLVVVQNMDNGEVVYDPRKARNLSSRGRPFITYSEKRWLADHPYWPAILELESNRVVDDECGSDLDLESNQVVDDEYGSEEGEWE